MERSVLCLGLVLGVVVGAPTHARTNSLITGTEMFEFGADAASSVPIVRAEDVDVEEVEVWEDSPYLPVIQMHGMGDFAENPLGMVPLRKAVSKQLNGTYVTNIALGGNVLSDMFGSFLEVMDKEVEIFAKAVQSDPKLANGFNAIGYSQGGLTIRGYVEKYNNPPVKNFISVHGIVAGVAGFPHCNFTSEICELFDNLLGAAAYNELSQRVLAQANYFRDPLRIDAFKAHCHFLPDINNENTVNATYKENFSSLNKLVLVKALRDTMVWPNDSEWFGFYKDGSDKEKVAMENTTWYKDDLFGLRTLDEAGKLVRLTTPGDHLQFDTEFLLELVDTYFK